MTSRVLIVDDNHDLADNLAELLEEEGYTVETAYSGERALDLAAAESFDTILTDVRMPGMSGVDLVKRLQGLNPCTSFLLMTAYSSDAVLGEALRAGVRAVLTKPVDLDLLLARLPHDVAKVLVLEGDAAVGAELVAALSSRGYTAFLELDCAKAEARVREGGFDAVVLDAFLPGCNSTELARSLCLTLRVPVVLLSGELDGAANVLESLPSDCVRFLNKPFQPDALFDALRSVIDVAPGQEGCCP